MSLFSKAAIFTDIHFGEHQDSEQHNRDCLDFLEWFAEQTAAKGCDSVIFMGDWHHNRVRTENRTAWFSRQGIEVLEGMDLPIYWIVGNHELYLKESRDIHSLQHISRYSNFHLINHLTKIDDVVFSPWLVGDEHENLLRTEGRYIFGHFELPFFLMNQVIEKTYEGKGLHIDDFSNCEAVYSGHFHKRQLKLNTHKVPIYYVGNCFGHNFNDANDLERGMAVLKWGETLPDYLEWPNAPAYLRYQMSDFVALFDSEEGLPFSERSVIEITDDMDLDNDTLNELRSAVSVRNIRFKKIPKEHVETAPDGKHYASLDDMVESKLKSMGYDSKFDVDLLVQLYREV